MPHEQRFEPIKLGSESDVYKSVATFDPNSVEGQVELFFASRLAYPLQAQIAHGIPEDTGVIKDALASSDYLGKPIREFYVWLMDEPGTLPSGREGDVLCWIRVYEDDRVHVGVHSEEAQQLPKTLYDTFGEQNIHSSQQHPKHNKLPKIAVISGAGLGVLALGLSMVSGWLKGPQVSVPLDIPEHVLQTSQNMEFLRGFENKLGKIQQDINSGITDFRTQPSGLRSADLLYFHQVLQENDSQALKAAIPLLQQLATMSYKTDGTVITSNTNIPSDLYTDLITRAPQLLERIKEKSSDQSVDDAARRAIIEINKAKEEAATK